jgi:CDP-2,3-bis-(O-geranylgeranyl)-sn-glycerol synthase
MFVAVMLVGGVAQGVVMRFDLGRRLAVPLDGGHRLRGRRVFGDNKTVRGAVVMVVACALGATVLLPLNPPGAPPAGGWVWAGTAMGLAYIVAELPNSFVKRQLDIAPGSAGNGLAGTVQYLVDQSDSVLGVVGVVWWMFGLTATEVVLLVVVGVLAHIGFDVLLRRAHAK